MERSELEEIMRLDVLSVVVSVYTSVCLCTQWLSRNGGAPMWKFLHWQRYAL